MNCISFFAGFSVKLRDVIIDPSFAQVIEVAPQALSHSVTPGAAQFAPDYAVLKMYSTNREGKQVRPALSHMKVIIKDYLSF